jgi:hypothetical protein
VNELSIGSLLATVIYVSWALSAAVLILAKWMGRRPAAAVHLFHELKPFVVPVRIVGFVFDSILRTDQPGWLVFGLVVDLGFWWLVRRDGDDDDRWKRRGRRLSERVAQIGARLTVEPAPVVA